MKQTTVVEVEIRTSWPWWFWGAHVVIIGSAVVALIVEWVTS